MGQPLLRWVYGSIGYWSYAPNNRPIGFGRLSKH